MTQPTIETLKALATPKNPALKKTFVTSMLFLVTAVPLTLSHIFLKHLQGKGCTKHPTLKHVH